MDVIRFGILGAGRIGKVHARTIAESGQASVTVYPHGDFLYVAAWDQMVEYDKAQARARRSW